MAVRMLVLLGLISAAERTEKRRMCRHICALQHLRKPSKCTNDVLNQLEGRLCALAERLCETLGVIWVARHAHATVHAAHPHPTHPTHSTVHAAVSTAVHRAHAAETRVRRGIAVVAAAI